MNTNYETITLAGGCFWCLEAVFDEMKGVLSVDSGYANGHVANPSYRDVCTGMTGHAEVAQIKFDPAVSPSAMCSTSSSPFTIPPLSTARARTLAHSTAPASTIIRQSKKRLPRISSAS